jgi:hypothetical protein
MGYASSVVRRLSSEGRQGCLCGGSRSGGLSLREVEQAPKGIWWMPRHQEAMKDVARCEKPWGGASNL